MMPVCFNNKPLHSSLFWFRWFILWILVDLSYPKLVYDGPWINQNTLYGWNLPSRLVLILILFPFACCKRTFSSRLGVQIYKPFSNLQYTGQLFFKKSLFLLSKQLKNNFAADCSIRINNPTCFNTGQLNTLYWNLISSGFAGCYVKNNNTRHRLLIL